MMNIAEVEGVARYIKTNFPKFYLEPAAIAKRWHGVIGNFSKNEALDAVDYLGKSSDFMPNERSIRDRCQLVRKQIEQREYNREQSHLYSEADLSFEGVPGATRAAQILWVCADQAAIHYRSGNRNGAFDRLLMDAKNIGIEFDGIDYTTMDPSLCSFVDGFLKFER